MKYRKLGKSGIEISELSIGAMSFTAKHKDAAYAILDYGMEHGINFIDTADLYEKGANESLISNWLKNRRQDVVIATKVGNRWKQDGSGWDWVPSKSYILEAVDLSLKRLQTDYIDLYQLHGGTIEDPLDEVIEAFELLVDAGKIRTYGISSIRPNTIRKFTVTGQPASVMMQYSMLDRRPEEEALNYLQQRSIGVLARGVLAKGLLAGKSPAPFLNYSDKEVADLQKTIADTADSLKLALQFVLKNPAISSAVLGFSSLKQIQQVMKAYGDAAYTSFPEGLLKKLPLNFYEQHR